MAHIHEKYDFTVSAFIVHDEKVLLIDHKGLNLWLPIGGHIELDEDPEMSLWREIEEESGLQKPHLELMSTKPAFKDSRTKILHNPNYMDVHDINETHKHISFTYFLKSSTNQITLAEAEHHQIKWLSLDEIEKREFNTTEAVRFYSREAVNLSQV